MGKILAGDSGRNSSVPQFNGSETGQNEKESLMMRRVSLAEQAEAGLWEMEEYSCAWGEMIPLTKETASELFDCGLTVYQLHKNGTETLIVDREQVTEHEGIFGIEKADWENEREFRTMQAELAESSANKAVLLLYGISDQYGIYQRKETPPPAQFCSAGTEPLEPGVFIENNFDAVKLENYNLVYTGRLSGLQKGTKERTLDAVYKKLNTSCPEDFKGHPLTAGDVVVLHEKGENSAYFMDSSGFTRIPGFLHRIEGGKESSV